MVRAPSGGAAFQRAPAASEALLKQLRANEQHRCEELQWQLTVQKSQKSAVVRDRDLLSRLCSSMAKQLQQKLLGGGSWEGAGAKAGAARLRRAMSLEVRVGRGLEAKRCTVWETASLLNMKMQ